MKLFKKALTVVAMAGVFGGVAQASMINVGGVVWDPDSVQTGTTLPDFNAQVTFNQFFTTAGNAVSSTTNAAPNYANAISPVNVPLGSVLQGAGEVFSMNGNVLNPTSVTGGDATSFCPGCELTFVFGGYLTQAGNTLSNGWLNLYVDHTPDFNAASRNPGAGANAADGTLWLSLNVSSNSFSNQNDYLSGTLVQYFDVIGGLAKNNFDTNGLPVPLINAFSDLLSSAAATFQPTPGVISSIGTGAGTIVGNSIPEPSTIFLFGLALLGLGLARRQPKSK